MINTDFPENIFQIPSHKEALYKYKLNAGKDICNNKSIFFCGIVRDVDNTLESNILRLHRTGKLFKDYHIFIYENDSIDNTQQILIDYRSDNLTFLSENRQDKDYKINISNGSDVWHNQRCKVLAQCRNKYLEYFRSLKKHFDYICVVDLDVFGGWSYDGILHGTYILEDNPLNACVSSYGVLSHYHNYRNLEDYPVHDYIMYDSLAFRPLNLKGMVHMLRVPMFNRITFTRGDDPINVTSNFGGMAIYKSEMLQNKSYDSVHVNGSTDPDHVYINKQIVKDGFNIVLDPSMIVSYSHHKYSRTIND